MWSATAALQMDIPGEKFEAMREAGIHFHAFATAGTLLPLAALSGAPKDAIKVVRDATRASLGVGIVWPLPIGQIEMNYGKVVRAGQTIASATGFKWASPRTYPCSSKTSNVHNDFRPFVLSSFYLCYRTYFRTTTRSTSNPCASHASFKARALSSFSQTTTQAPPLPANFAAQPARSRHTETSVTFNAPSA